MLGFCLIRLYYDSDLVSMLPRMDFTRHLSTRHNNNHLRREQRLRLIISLVKRQLLKRWVLGQVACFHQSAVDYVGAAR